MTSSSSAPPARIEPTSRGSRWVRLARTHSLATFYLLAFAFSWAYWIAVIATGGQASHFPGLAGPALAAVVATGLIGGRAGLLDLAHRMVRWRVHLRWYLAALVPAIAGAIGLVTSVAMGTRVSAVDLVTMDGVPTQNWLPFLAILLLVNGYGEEVGWRGFAWDRHRSRHEIFGAALRLGSLWALWHLPTFWLATGMTMEPWMIPAWLISLLAGAVVLGWLYERSGRSLVVVALFHTCLNLASATTASEPVAAVTSAVVIVWAVTIIKGGR